MKKLFVWLLLLCLVINVAMVSTALCQDDEKEPPEGYVEVGPDLAAPPPDNPPLGVYPVWYDAILIVAGLIIGGYICLVTYMHYKEV